MPAATATTQEYKQLKDLGFADDDTEEPDDGHIYGCADCGHRAKCQMLTYILYVSGLLLAATCIAISILVWKLNTPAPSTHAEQNLQDVDDYRMTSLGRDSRYMTTNHSSDSLWGIMLEDKLGEYATPDGPFDRGEFSMFHQLRCVARFRLAIQQASEGVDVGTDFRHDHWAHCLDYMRKIVLCNADSTIERPRIALQHPDGTAYTGIEGAEELRRCRPIQPMCDTLEQYGLARSSCIAGLDPTLHPWYWTS